MLAQVCPIPGAGGVFGGGPAPQNRLLRTPVAQVPFLFPHLHQKPPTPAPTYPYTCTKSHPSAIDTCVQKPSAPAPTYPQAYGAGMPYSWRRYALFLAQVGFLVGDLRRKTGSYALQWCRSRPFFLTCAKNHQHLRQKAHTPAPRGGKGEKEQKKQRLCQEPPTPAPRAIQEPSTPASKLAPPIQRILPPLPLPSSPS